jgi:hypothetical protein
MTLTLLIAFRLAQPLGTSFLQAVLDQFLGSFLFAVLDLGLD